MSKHYLKVKDERIGADNYLVELPIRDYLKIAKSILEENEFQRRRVRASKSIYSLLKEDILKGCVIPPISLAVTENDPEFERRIEEGIFEALDSKKKNILILDGLQRTYSILDLENELLKRNDEAAINRLYSRVIRLEIYAGLNRLGILYRMLTLNTGQTPMSLRQQIEMLYLNYYDIDIPEVEIIRESEGKQANGVGQYNFKDIVEGFNSYLERNELPIGRVDLLDNIKGLEKLSDENNESDIFREYLLALHTFLSKIKEITNDDSLLKEHAEEEDLSKIFGKNTTQIFKKAQSVSGFGAAIGKLKDFKIIHGFSDIISMTDKLELDDDDIQTFLVEFNKKLYWINQNASKIGNAQRNYFQFFFRELFNKETDSYLDLLKATETSFEKYRSQNF
ncbi:hypothetical protein [Aeromonas veronii]|uniref:hypothetical protein n=1 Tax=Aeromonas veronii TaxID=654 RepID=UPI003F79DCBB